MVKITLGISAALAVACVILFLLWDNTKKELTQANMDLALAQEVIKVREKELQVSDTVLVQLKIDSENLRKERDATAKTLKGLLENPENAAWGNTETPEDVRKFLLEFNNTKGGVK